MTEGKLRSLIVTIVRKGWGECVIDASCKAGAEGGTIMFGRGTGDHEQQKILGITIEPEKEIVLTVIARDEADGVLAEIVKSCEMDKPGRGIGFVINLEKVGGVVHIQPDSG